MHVNCSAWVREKDTQMTLDIFKSGSVCLEIGDERHPSHVNLFFKSLGAFERFIDALNKGRESFELLREGKLEDVRMDFDGGS